MPDHLARDKHGTALTPTDVANLQSRLAETERALAETKDQLGRVNRRSLELHDQTTKRKLSDDAITVLLDEAVARDRIGDGDRDEWGRRLAENPSETVIELAQDREYSADEIEAQSRDIAARHNLNPSEVL